MVRAIFRLLSMFVLAVAVIMAVLDATRSIAADALVMTPLRVSWSSVSPDTLDALEKTVTGSLPAFVWDPVVTGILQMPGFAVFAVLSLVLAMIGRRPARKAPPFVLQR